MVETNIKDFLEVDIEKVWSIVTDNNNYLWRRDIKK